MLTAGGHRWRLSTDSFGWASSGCEIGRDDVVRGDVRPGAEPRCCLVECHDRNIQYMSDAWTSLRRRGVEAGAFGRLVLTSRYPDHVASVPVPS
jgi:hypothetical protein